MKADLAESKARDKSAAGVVLREQLPKQLVEAGALGFGREGGRQSGPDPTAAAPFGDINAGLAHTGVAGPRAVRRDSPPANDLTSSFSGDQDRRPRRAKPRRDIGWRS